jgi:hypothetical protein
MLPMIGLQLLTAAAAMAALFLKRDADFSPYVSVILGVIILISGGLSILLFRGQDADVKFLRRNVENLVRSISPNSYVRKTIIAEISRQAGTRGLPRMKVSTYEDDFSAFSFYVDDEVNREGLLLLERDGFNSMAVVSEHELPSRVKSCFDQRLNQDPSREWDSLVRELGEAGRYVASENGADPSISSRIWADQDKRETGIATARHLQQPNVILNSSKISEFQALPRIKRHQELARLIEAAL